MDEPIWIEDKIIIAVHGRQISEHGGSAGIRDEGTLASALARPKQKWAYGGPDIDYPALAAAYIFGIARDHAFIDGNKRTAAVIGELFLVLNGLTLAASDMDLYPVCMAVASGEMGEDELTHWLRDNIRPAQVTEESGAYG
jgi:death-on-curing protein